MKHLNRKYIHSVTSKIRAKLGKQTETLNRVILTGLGLVLVMTSAHVGVAGATAPVNVEPIKNTPVASDLQAIAEVSKEIPVVVEAPKAVQKKKTWNTINSADLETKPEYSSEPAVRTTVVPTTAYTSDPAETDSTPFTTADGSRVRDGIVAANFLPHGTRIRIPDYFGNKVFEVHDRMNKRYQTRVDIWMVHKSDAYAWGVRNVKIEILP